ncbi:syntaphilin isoform X2 [Coregonus clupeaformis]|uniref:syntaphilin isoform X2 n=1 Tax=Coregonus clupeaformis TaxID=59861 RepID=UPI001BE07F57|nr:syntaphilin isoform X2 [Coregonus clupeaformis]
MSAPVPSTRRSASGSRRFNPLNALQPKRRLQQMLSSSSSPVRVPTPPARTAAPVSNRDPYGNASLSSSTNSGSCKGSDCSPTKGRHMKAYTSCTDNHGIRPPPPEQYLTPLQQKEVCIRHLRARLKETVDRLQDRDSEIDELRTQLSRMQEDWVEEECHHMETQLALKEARVETQLALKEARVEIQQLKEVVDMVRNNLSSSDSTDTGVQKYFQDINVQNHKLETLLLSMELAQNGVAKEQESAAAGRGAAGWSGAGWPGTGRSGTAGSWPGSSPAASGTGGGGSKSLCGSCDGSPARSLTHSFTYTKLSDHALADKNGDGLSGEETHDSGFVCCGESHSHSAASSRSAASSQRADLLLEAAFLSKETASLLSTYSHLPHFSTYEKLCSGQDRVAPLRCAMGEAGSASHPCLSHHHLYLHHPREQAVQTESCPVPVGVGYASDLDTIAERTFRSQACSPTSTWVSDEGDDLDSVTATSVTTTTLTATTTEPRPGPPLPSSSCLSVEEDGEALGELERQTEVVGESAGGMVEVGKQEENGGLVQLCEQEEVKVLGSVGEGKQEEVRELDVDNQREEVEMVEVRSVEVEEVRSVEVEEEEVRSVEVEVQPQTSQPRSSLLQQEEIAGVTVVEVNDDDEDEDQAEVQGAVGGEEESTSSGSGPPVKSYWSRHFLVDLLAVAVPVVPTVAWLCRGPRGDALPVYHFGSLLRGCCTVALSSLRRGGGIRHYPAGTGGGAMGGTEI